MASIVVSSFWDSDTTGMNSANGGTGLQTAAMKTAAPYAGAGWDFSTVWEIAPGSYPHLRKNPSPPN